MEGRFVVLTEDIRKVLFEDRVRFEKTMQITVITDGIFGNHYVFHNIIKDNPLIYLSLSNLVSNLCRIGGPCSIKHLF
jgi:hypothetical protein